jgi:hypothetical protein
VMHAPAHAEEVWISDRVTSRCVVPTCAIAPPKSVECALRISQKGHREQALDRHRRRMTYIEGECSTCIEG